MHFSILCGFLFIYGVSGSPNDSKDVGDRPDSPLRQLKDDNSITTTSCGGILNGTSGEISYKLSEPFGANERCVWILRAKNMTDYSIGIFNLGFPSPHSNHQVTISGFALGVAIKQVMPSETGLYNLSNCSIIIIVFHSGDSNPLNYNGFSLQYSAFHVGGVRAPASVSYDVVIDSKNVGYIKYPESRVNYTNLELAAFLFPQKNRNLNPYEDVAVVIATSGMEALCYDFLYVYYFNVDSADKWDKTDRICSTKPASIFSHNDLMLAVFKSDVEVTGSAFHITYSRCSGGNDDGGEGEFTTTEGFGTTTEDLGGTTQDYGTTTEDLGGTTQDYGTTTEAK